MLYFKAVFFRVVTGVYPFVEVEKADLVRKERHAFAPARISNPEALILEASTKTESPQTSFFASKPLPVAKPKP